MFNFFKKPKRLTPERQLRELQKMGISHRAAVQTKEILKFRPEAYEEEPYKLLLISLGGQVRSQEPISDQIWLFDQECIYGPGDYAKIAARMRGMSGGELPLTDIADDVDLAGGTAQLEFMLEGEKHRWTFAVRQNSVDMNVIRRFAWLLRSRSSRKWLTRLNLYGNHCLIGCWDENQLE